MLASGSVLNSKVAARTPLINAPNGERQSIGDLDASLFKSMQWTPDGTSIIAATYDNKLHNYILPTDLLTSPTPHNLTPYHTISTPSAPPTYVLYPYYALSNLSTTLALIPTKALPIRLTNTLTSTIHATYPLIHGPTETYITPHSLLFTRNGTRFLSGSDSLLASFDLSRDGQDPVTRFPTIPSKRKKLVGGGVGIKGIVSALGVSCDRLIAAGTFTRCVGLYADEGEGDAVAHFSIEGEEKCVDDNGGGGGGEEVDIGGGGITQTLWSPCGRYLYIAERRSDGVLIYDVRVTGKKLGVLRGRAAKTNQRMGVEVVASRTGEVDSGAGHDVWAGGTDGLVRVWRSPHTTGGVVDASEGFVGHDDAVSSSIMHPFANVLATCSGQRHFDTAVDDGSPSSSEFSEPEITPSPKPRDNCIKVWCLDANSDLSAS